MAVLRKVERFLRRTNMPETGSGGLRSTIRGWCATCETGASCAHGQWRGSKPSSPSTAGTRDEPGPRRRRPARARAGGKRRPRALPDPRHRRRLDALGERHLRRRAPRADARRRPVSGARCVAGRAADAEFALRGHLVADLVVESMRRVGDAITITLEALTVEEG